MTSHKYAIIGYPLAHSFSPQIHNQVFAEYKLSAKYTTLEIHPDSFEQHIRKLKNENWAGFNITVPFKEQILPFLDKIDPQAKKITAVNTIQVLPNGSWKGYNTDFMGFLKPLEEFKANLVDCLILGAGGAARAVAFGILSELPVKNITIVNRTVEKGKSLVNNLATKKNIQYDCTDFNKIPKHKFDLIVNTTTLGMGKLQNELPLDPQLYSHPDTIVYDLIYNPTKTLFLEAAKKAGFRTINGLPMLVYQAEAAFKIWTGKDFSERLISSFLK